MKWLAALFGLFILLIIVLADRGQLGILALLIGLEEFSQIFFPNRSFDLVDLAFSYLGVFFFSWLALRIKQ